MTRVCLKLRSVGPLVVALAIALVAARADAAKKYKDPKKRFSLTLPEGWRITPMPGDTQGMTFRRDKRGTFALLRVSVRRARPRETPKATLDGFIAPFEAEIGFKRGTDLPSQLGLWPASARTFTVYASGDKNTVRAIEVHVLHAFGYVHIMQMEARKQDRRRFRKDFDRIMASYKPRIGRAIYAPLVAKWDAVDDGPPLILDENGLFKLGPLSGTYRADGGRLTMYLTEGQEFYRYQIKGRTLTLKSSNLDAPKRYERFGARRIQDPDDAQAAAPVVPLTRAELVGRWRVVDTPSSDPLVLHLAPTGSVSFGPLAGRWGYRRGLLTITAIGGPSVTYHVSKSRDGSRITMGGGDLDREMILVRE